MQDNSIYALKSDLIKYEQAHQNNKHTDEEFEKIKASINAKIKAEELRIEKVKVDSMIKTMLDTGRIDYKERIQANLQIARAKNIEELKGFQFKNISNGN